jgi:uncharacterized membrane protein
VKGGEKSKMSKDKAIGGLIVAVCIIVAIAYAVLVIFPTFTASVLGMKIDANTGLTVRLYAVLIPVFIACIAVLAIFVWIGFTMATAADTKPIEEAKTEAPTDKEPSAT